MPPKKAASSNKYNVRAVRKELDSCIRSAAWKPFRLTLDSMTAPSSVLPTAASEEARERDITDTSTSTSTAAAARAASPPSSAATTDTSLLKAVVLERSRSSQGTPSVHPTLLHALVSKLNTNASAASCIRSGRGTRREQPPPYDIIETIASCVPEALLVQDLKAGRTPLFLTLRRNACPSIIECLVKHDTTRRSLDLADSFGVSPLLYHVSKSNNIDVSRDGVAGILIRYDTDGRTLIANGRPNETPLHMVAVKELRQAGLMRYGEQNRHGAGGGEDVRLPDPIRYLLVKTQAAEAKRMSAKNIAYHDKLRYELAKTKGDLKLGKEGKTLTSQEAIAAQKEGLRADEEHEEHEKEEDIVEIDTSTALRAAIACSEYLYGLHLQIIQLLFHEADSLQGIDSDAVFTSVDERGNTAIHLFCLSRDELISYERRLDRDLIDRCSAALRLPNADGDLPMHLAAKSGKPWEDIRTICEEYPDAAQRRNRKGELPLHVALKNPTYMYYDDYIPLAFTAAEELLKLWPDALHIKDEGMGLYPFQIPADREIITRLRIVYRRLKDVDTELAALSGCYIFLRKMPDLCDI
mmetsp:Transcript_30744/g.68101  ORF Transcript_30744/g.68101 Transcript_30744/m.68101 type:complete len:582 (+) Transcript_30744:164-1909(+)